MIKITVVGNMVNDPVLRFTNSGMAVCDFTVADNYKSNKDAEDQVSFIEVTLWGTLAENFSESLHKGQRVIVEGRLQQQNWETDDGQKRSKLKLIADGAGPDLRFQKASVTNVGKRESVVRDPRSSKFEDPF